MKNIYNRLIRLPIRKGVWYMLGCFLLLSTTGVRAACGIKMMGIACVGNSLTFSTDAISGSVHVWDFNGEGSGSQPSSAFIFNMPGFKSVVVEVQIPGQGICRDTFRFQVFPRAVVRTVLVSSDTQCLRGNQFCFSDSSAFYDTCIQSIRYLFDDGELITINRPNGVRQVCKTIGGVVDASVGYTIEVVSCNQCVTTFRSPKPLVVRAVRPISFTSNRPEGCDTITGFFVNTSGIDTSEVVRFLWDFGDGTTQSQDWGSGGISHFYTTQGPFNGSFTVKLLVWQKWGCVDSFVMPSAVFNILAPTGLYLSDTQFCATDLVEVYPDGTFPPSMQFTWKITGPGSPVIFNEQRPFIRATRLGPHRIVMQTSHSICPDKEYSDTFVVVGPIVKIEELDSGVLLDQSDRYQCRSTDTVEFPNMTRYYRNDHFRGDDDSLVFVNGSWRYVFDSLLNPIPPHPIVRSDDKIFRIWEFGDPYAPQCTTNTNLGINVGRNCNFSSDRFPRHFYTPWDTIYERFFYQTNHRFIYLDFDGNGQCLIRDVDTTELMLHRRLFNNRIPVCYEASLKEMYVDGSDTLCVGEDITRVVIGKPDLSNIIVEGQGCITPSSTQVNLRVVFGRTNPGCSFNTIFFNPNVRKDSSGWIQLIGDPPFNGYEFVGLFPPDIVYRYDTSTISLEDDTLVVGIIVANGVGLNRCLDTIYVENPFDIQRAVARFDFLNTKGVVPKICKGDTILMGRNFTDPSMARNTRYSNWVVYKEDERNPNTRHYIAGIQEKRLFAQSHDHPDSTDILFDKVVIDRNLSRHFGEPSVSDTIIVNRIDKYELKADVTPVVSSKLLESWIGLGLPPAEFNIKDAIRMFWNGIGTFGQPVTGALGCIDTTGFSDLMKIRVFPEEGGLQILHPRDTSLLPTGSQWNQGVEYPHAHAFVPKENGVYHIEYMVESRDGCASTVRKRFVVGFQSLLEWDDTVICHNERVEMRPQFRYYAVDHGVVTVDTTDFWELRKQQSGLPGYEGVTKIDWHSWDDSLGIQAVFGTFPFGVSGYRKSYMAGGEGNGRRYYTQPGTYMARVTTSDSSGCKDTLTQQLYVLQTNALFGLNLADLNCDAIVEFFDSSSVSNDIDSILGGKAHELYRWEIDWGNGKQSAFDPALPPQVGHQFRGFGEYEVQLIAVSRGVVYQKEPMCRDTFYRKVFIPGPQPYFDPLSSLFICMGDSVVFENKSKNATRSAQFIWDMGDSSFFTTSGGETITHTYMLPGEYDVFLSQSDSLPGTIHFCNNRYPDTPFQPIIRVRVYPILRECVSADATHICPGDSVTFTLKENDEIIHRTWHIVGPGLDTSIMDSFANTLTYRFDHPGRFILTFIPGMKDTGYQIARCLEDDFAIIYVDSIRADFNIDSSSMPVQCFENTSTNSVRNRWGFYHEEDITQTNGIFLFDLEENALQFCLEKPDKGGHYWVCLIAESDIGCLDTVCKLVRFTEERSLYIPNVFTPGEDGFNDRFRILISGQDQFELWIHNRWGEKVFYSNDPSECWNGLVGNKGEKCPEGTYYYILNYRFEGERKTEKVNGVVTLIRE